MPVKVVDVDPLAGAAFFAAVIPSNQRNSFL
jgi:hypothetical protein